MPAVARKDGVDTVLTGHGCDVTTVTLIGSSTVFADGIGVCREGDQIEIHQTTSGGSCANHLAYINEGSSTVFADGIAIARKGDSTDLGQLITGSSTIFAGG